LAEALCHKSKGRGFDHRWVIGFFNWFNPSSRPGVDSAYNMNEYQEYSGGKGLPSRKADKLTAICKQIVYRKRERLSVSQHYGPQRPVKVKLSLCLTD
jgi:hypothetical protein